MSEDVETEDSPSVEKKVGALQKIFDRVIDIDASTIQQYVETLRAQNPGLSADELAEKIVSRKAMKNGLVGAVTGVPGFLLLPLTVPADVAWSWRIQASMVFAVAHVYGYTEKTMDLRTDLYILLAGNSGKEALKRLGIEVGKAMTRRAIQRVVTRELMKRVWQVVGRQIVTKAGTKSLTSVMKWVPLVGAPIGFAFDWVTSRAVGKYAIKYYSGRG